MLMLNELAQLFDTIDLNWCDNPGKEIHETQNYKKLLAVFPNLQNIFRQGLKDNPFEHLRTSRHIFRIFKIYFLIRKGVFDHGLLSSEAIQRIRRKLLKVSELDERYLPVIIMYHDIGRFYDRKTHAYQSSNLIAKEALFESFGFSEQEKLFLQKIIEYHLLLPTIYTGESTFFGVLSLINNKEFIKLISNLDTNVTNQFVDLLETFTYIDILGYPYSRIFDHYLKYYEEINRILKEILALWSAPDKIVSRAKHYSLQWTNWRLAGGLRIFQFVHTKPYLTEDFYYNILKESIQSKCEKYGIDFQWDEIKKKFFTNIYKFQLKYALPFLMLLAFNEFKRMRLKKGHKISSKLLQFWILLSREIDRRNLGTKEVVWNIFFENMPYWSEITKHFIEKLDINRLKNVVRNGIIKFDEIRREYNFYLDFSQL